MVNVPAPLRPRPLLQIFLCFFAPWFLCYAIISLVMKKLNGIHLLYILLPATVCFIIGVLITYFTYNKPKPSIVKVIIAIVGLCLADQAIKFYMANNKGISVALVRDLLAIEVAQNTYGSFVASLFGATLPIPIFLLVIIPICSILFRNAYLYPDNNPSFSSLIVILLYAAIICVFIDRIVYGGTYDYVLLYSLVHFDLKDWFAVIGVCMLLLVDIYDKSWDEIKKKSHKPPKLKYFGYETNAFRSILCLMSKYKNKRRNTSLHKEG